MKGKTIEKALLSAETLVNNSIGNVTVEANVVRFGYTRERLVEGKAIVDNARTMHEFQQKGMGEKIGATQELRVAFKALKIQYSDDKRIADIALKNDVGLKAALCLPRQGRRNYSDWFARVSTFYNNALSDETILEKLAVKGMTVEYLTQAQASFEHVEQIYFDRTKGIGDSQTATKDRNVVLKTMAEWVSDYRTVCKVAFRDMPQILETLGIVVHS